MPKVTALLQGRGRRLRVELDGAPWRTLPIQAVADAGLAPGVELDRERARRLRLALRRAEALERATAALARRDRATAGLDALLERGRVAPAERRTALATLARLGYLDDERFARGRAAALAARGFGDEAIRADLVAQGVGEDEGELALEALSPEPERARTVAAGLAPARAARKLAARGFSVETIEDVVGVFDAWG